MFAKRLMQLGGGGSEGDGDDKAVDDLPKPGPASELEGDDEAKLRRDLVGIAVRVFCVGRLRSSAFPVNGESRNLPYDGYDSEDNERRLLEEIDTLLANYLFEGDVEALRKFTLSVSSSGSSSAAPTYTVCGRLFKQQDVVYSCRDCALDNTCVLCANCFAQSAHTSHNYRMHASGGGGYCDCGDIEAWRSDPACRLHTSVSGSSTEQTAATPQVPPQVVAERARSFFRYVMRFVEQIFTGPMDLLSADLHVTFSKEYPAALSSWLTVLFNDEIHSFDEVIRTLRHAVSCSNSMAENFATLVDRKGRSIIFYGRQTACVNAVSRVSQRSAQENSKHMPLRVQASSFGAFQLQELSVRMLDSIVSRLLTNSPDLQRTILDALEVTCLSQVVDAETNQKLTLLDSLLLANSSLWKAARSSTHQFFMAAAFSLPECRRRFGISYARNYSQIMGNFVEKDFHHYKDSIVSLSVQLFTVPSLVLTLVEQLNFVVKVASAIRAAIEPAIAKDTDPASGVSREIIDTSKLQSMARTLPSPYAFAAHDFRYVLRSLPSEPPIWSSAIEEAVLRGFAAFVHLVLKPFTGTDSLTRRVGEHVEWDPVLTNAFSFFDSVHSALFLFYNRLVVPQKPDRLINAFSLVRSTLEASLRSLNSFSFQYVKLELRRSNGEKSSSSLPPPKQRKSEQSEHSSQSASANDQVIENLLSLQLAPITVEATCNSHSVTSDPVSLHNGVPRVIYDLMGGAATLGIQPWQALCGGQADAPDYGELQPFVVMEPALRVIVYQAQVQAGMWRRNGLAVAQQVAFYRHHSETCHQFDLDLLAVQLAAVAPGSSADQFLVQLLDKFCLTTWLSNSSSTDVSDPQKLKKQMSDVITRYGSSLIDEMLLLLVNLLTERFRPGVGSGVGQRECLRYRLIQRLATGPQPHSQLRESLLSHNDDADAESDLELLLAELAETRNRPTDGRTLFDLKPAYLDEFNPYTTCLERAELTRAEQHVREGLGRHSTTGRSTPIVLVPAKLPPFSTVFQPILNILTSPVFIEIVRIVLLKTLRRDNSLHQDFHVDKVLFLLAIVAIEQRRETGGLGKRFSDVPDTASLLSTLVQLQSMPSVPPSTQSQRGSSAPQPGELSKSQQDLIAWLVNELVPATNLAASSVSSTATAKGGEEMVEDTKQKKSDIAQQHRKKLMEKMAKLQRNFLEGHPELANIAQGTPPSAAPTIEPMEVTVTGASSPVVTSNIIQQMFDASVGAVCMVCQDQCRPAVVARLPDATAPSQHIVVPGGSAPETAATSSPIACFVACMQRCYVLAQKNVATPPPSIYMSVCGHNIHSYCWQRYTESQQARPRHRFLPGVLAALFGSNRGQQLANAIAPCPLCESLGNAVIPLVDVRPFLPTSSCSWPQETPSVLVDACKLLMAISDPDERDYRIVSDHRTNSTLTSPFSGSTGNAVSNALTAYGRTVANVLVAQAAAHLSSGAPMAVPLKAPTSPDELVRFIAMAIAHTGRCIVSTVLTFNAAEVADENGVFTGAVRRHLDCLIAASQAGVATSLLAADSFCAVNILRIVTANVLNYVNSVGENGEPVHPVYTAPPLVDSGELLSHLWLLEPLIRTGLQSPESSISYVVEAFWLCFLLEVGRALSTFAATNPSFTSSEEETVPRQSLAGLLWSAISPQSPTMPPKSIIYKSISRALIPFIRLVTLLASAILNKPLSLQAFISEPPDVATLCHYALGLTLDQNPIDILFTDDENLKKQVPDVVNIVVTRFNLLSADLSLVTPPANARRLVSLPVNYADLLSRAAAFTCPFAGQSLATGATSSSQQPVLCLLCDSMVCGSSCEFCLRRLSAPEMADAAKPNPMLVHAMTCSGGRGLFLRLHDCCLLVIADVSGRTIKHPSMYTDRYGEPDPGLRRGGPLILSRQRFAEVERLWLSHDLANIAFKYYSSGRSAAADLIFAGLDPGALAMVGLDPAGLL